MDEELARAIGLLEEFAGTYDAVDLVDPDMKLTAADIHRVIAAAKRGADVVEIRAINLSDMHKL